MKLHFRRSAVSRLSTIALLSGIVSGLLLWCRFSSEAIQSPDGLFYTVIGFYGAAVLLSLFDVLFAYLPLKFRQVSGYLGVASFVCTFAGSLLLTFFRVQRSSWSTMIIFCYMIGMVISAMGGLRAIFNLRVSRLPIVGEDENDGFGGGNSEPDGVSGSPIDYDNVIEAEVEDINNPSDSDKN